MVQYVLLRLACNNFQIILSVFNSLKTALTSADSGVEQRPMTFYHVFTVWDFQFAKGYRSSNTSL